MSADDEAAVEGLTTLGLSTYEAKVFVGLHRLGTGSAGEVAEVTDVPRSQVYGAAEGLEELGLIDIQEGTPTEYRPISVSEARYVLFDRVKRAGDTAFDHVEAVAGSHADEEDTGESVWRTDGSDSIAQRAAATIATADEHVTYLPADASRLEPSVVEALSDAVDRGVTVELASGDEAVRTAAREAGIEVSPVDETASPDLSSGRVLVVDGDTVLLSVLPTDRMPDVSTETGFWSEDTAFARILVTLLREWLDEHVAVDTSAADDTPVDDTPVDDTPADDTPVDS